LQFIFGFFILSRAMRKLFALIYTAEPPAVDVVREDFVTGIFKAGNHVKFQCFMGQENKSDVYEEADGEILLIGSYVILIASIIAH